MSNSSNKIKQRAISVFASVFGLATIISGGSVALRVGAAHDLAGDVVPFVVWFNFAAGFTYLIAAVGIWFERDWAQFLAVIITVATALVAVGFAIAVAAGHAFEMRTVGALGLRFLVWLGISIWLIRRARK